MSGPAAAADHIAHLLVHGALHAHGHDHEVEAEATEKEALETAILGGWGCMIRTAVDVLALSSARAAGAG